MGKVKKIDLAKLFTAQRLRCIKLFLDYSLCLVSPNQNETGRKLSWILLLIVELQISLFIIYGAKHLNFGNNGCKY